MNVELLTVGEFQANCFVVWGESREALVIDAGAEADRINDFLRTRGLGVACCLLTHGHVDHVSAVSEVASAWDAPIALHAEDASWAFHARNRMPPFYDAPAAPDGNLVMLGPGDDREEAGLRYQVLEAPGHTAGSVCFHFPEESALFTGDTLFAGSVGRTDLPGGDGRQLAESLRSLISMPDGLVVYPGHGPVTRLGTEKRENVFLRMPEL